MPRPLSRSNSEGSAYSPPWLCPPGKQLTFLQTPPEQSGSRLLFHFNFSYIAVRSCLTSCPKIASSWGQGLCLHHSWSPKSTLHCVPCRPHRGHGLHFCERLRPSLPRMREDSARVYENVGLMQQQKSFR